MDKKAMVPWGEIGYITFKRTYARRVDEGDINSRTEEFDEVVQRELLAADEQLHCNFTEEEKKRYFETRMKLKWTPGGRFMWQLGTKTVEKLGLPSLQNCAFTVIDEPVRPFVWTMDMLMLGSGVGFNIQRENVYKLPRLKGVIKVERSDSNDVDFIVPDNREGWVKLLGKVLKAHFYTGKNLTYSTKCIRSKGAPIRGFGGVASGPEELCWGINEINTILNRKAGKKLEPIDCLDIVNIIGAIVVAGNVRRSALLALGDYDDINYLKAKRWDLESVPNWRAMSNNSVVAPRKIKYLPKEYWETYEQGEPYGLVNIDLCRKIGRTGETQYPDLDVSGVNPCSEQTLADKETCCLAEMFLPNIESYSELKECLVFAYRICKHSLTLPCHLSETEEIVHKNMRMGIGMTGILQATEEQRSWLNDAYLWLREYDVQYSKRYHFPTSIKLTTVKPSGTVSLLAGVTPGVHPNPAGPYYIRRIRIAAGSPLLEVCKAHGYEIEAQLNFDGTTDKNTKVVSFPCKVSKETPIAATFGWEEQLEAVRRMQREWSDNSVSCTVYYQKEDLPAIKEYLAKYFPEEMKAVSFLLYQGHGFVQAPYETISEERYTEMVTKTRPITSVKVDEDDFEINECAGGACPIK